MKWPVRLLWETEKVMLFPVMKWLEFVLVSSTVASRSALKLRENPWWESSMVISKVQGNIVDILLPPLSPMEMLIGFTVGAVARGLIVGAVTCLVVSFFVPITITSIPLVVSFAILGTMMLGCLGLAAGVWSEKFDHIAAVTNFIVTPLTFLSGTFYAVESLPKMWQGLALYNPFFYMIDGFRAGFIGQSDGDPYFGLIFLIGINIALIALTYRMLSTGYKIKS